MIEKRQIGFIKNYSEKNLINKNFKQERQLQTPLQKPQFSSFHYEYPDSDDNDFSVFVLKHNITKKSQKRPYNQQYQAFQRQKQIKSIETYKTKPVLYPETKNSYQNVYTQKYRGLSRNYYSTTNLEYGKTNNILKNSKLLLNKKKLEDIGRAHKQVDQAESHKINFSKKNLPSKQVEESQVIKISQQLIVRKKIFNPSLTQQKNTINQAAQEKMDKLVYSQSEQSDSQKYSQSQSQGSSETQSEAFQSEPSQILPKQTKNSYKGIISKQNIDQNSYKKIDNKIVSRVYGQIYVAPNKQGTVHKINYQKSKNIQPANMPVQSSQQQNQYQKIKSPQSKRADQSYQRLGIAVSKGGLCFDINPKDFIVSQQEATQMKKKQMQNKKSAVKVKKNVNSIQQKRRRRQLAKNYDRYSRHQIFGNY